MARLLDLERFKGCPIPEDDPFRWYYFPVIGRLYHLRVDRALNLLAVARPKRNGTPSRVLEVGYGSGTSFLELIDRFDEVHGLDMHNYGQAVTETFAREGIKVHLTQGSILDPPYPDHYFDAVLAISVLEHLQPTDQPQVMSQVNRLLRPSGIFVVGMPGLNKLMSLGFRMLGCDIRNHHFSNPDLALEAAAKVFTIDRMVKLPAFGPNFCLLYLWFRARNA